MRKEGDIMENQIDMICHRDSVIRIYNSEKMKSTHSKRKKYDLTKYINALRNVGDDS